MVNVLIYSSARTAMQSGCSKSHAWIMKFEPTSAIYHEPIMQWRGSSDTRSQMMLRFTTYQQALDFAARQGWNCILKQPHDQILKPKSYMDNFKSKINKTSLTY